MKSNFLSVAAACLFTLGGLFGLGWVNPASAQILVRPAQQQQQQMQQPQSQQSARGLTPEAMLAFLKGKGQDARLVGDLKDAQGRVIGQRFSVSVRHDNLTLPLRVDLQGGSVWVVCGLGYLKSEVSAGDLQRLLESQRAIGPSHFQFFRTQEGVLVELAHRIDRNVTTERLQGAFTEYLGDFSTSRQAWEAVIR